MIIKLNESDNYSSIGWLKGECANLIKDLWKELGFPMESQFTRDRSCDLDTLSSLEDKIQNKRGWKLVDSNPDRPMYYYQPSSMIKRYSQEPGVEGEYYKPDPVSVYFEYKNNPPRVFIEVPDSFKVPAKKPKFSMRGMNFKSDPNGKKVYDEILNYLIGLGLKIDEEEFLTPREAFKRNTEVPTMEVTPANGYIRSSSYGNVEVWINSYYYDYRGDEMTPSVSVAVEDSDLFDKDLVEDDIREITEKYGYDYI